MKPYPKYKDSGVEWIGEVPEGWEAICIKRLSPVKRGASPRPIHDQKYFDIDGEFAWVRIADLSASERYLENTTQTLSELGASLSVKCFPGDFFLSIAGTVGKPIITKIKCCIHDGFVYFPELAINHEYLYYIFSTGLPYQGLGKWGTQLNLNTDTVGEICIPIPSDTEIVKIVAYLDRKTAEIDNLIANKERLIALYEEEKKAVINQAVTKGLDPDAEMKDSGVEWLGEVPAHWVLKKIKYIVELKSGDNITSDQISDDANYPVYGGNGLRGYYDSYTHEGTYVLIGRQGALCGNINYASGKFWASEHAVVATFKGGYELKWFGELLRVMNLNQYSVSAAQPGLSVDNIKNLPVPVPSKNEQSAIVHHIETQCSHIDAIIAKFKQQIKLFKEYRTALISEAVTGKIDVRDN
jgi:type I restriction enzyme S subunit